MPGTVLHIVNEGSERAVMLGDITIRVPLVSSAPRSVIVCAQIHQYAPLAPLIIVTHGALVELLPSIALAQRTAHRSVAGYVLIDPVMGAPTLDWPDAPVLVISEDPKTQRDAALRSWRVSADLNPVSAVPAFAESVLPI